MITQCLIYITQFVISPLPSDVPLISTLYPFFHPNRSQFFNMPTLYKAALESIDEGLLKAFPNLDLSNILKFEKITDKSYLEWELHGGVDLQLPSFKLTNRQMLWVCMAHVLSRKYHRNVPKHIDETTQIVLDNFNIYFKQNTAFRKAFECDNLTNIERIQLEEYRNAMTSYHTRQRNKQ